MAKYSINKKTNLATIKFYLRASHEFRFPFYHPDNPLRKNGLFDLLEDTLNEIGEKLRNKYGENFLSINLRGSWLRGIPTAEDDIDVLFIVNDLPAEDQNYILDFTRKSLFMACDLFMMCAGKIEGGVRTDPITFLDLSQVSRIMNSYMYGLGSYFSKQINEQQRDDYQDFFMGSRIREKKLSLLKSGILIPYVGWIYGKENKSKVFDTIAEFLPIPSQNKGLYSKETIEECKQTIRQAFLARNLIYPSLKIQHLLDLKKWDVTLAKNKALSLFKALEAIESIHARAVVNYIYLDQIEVKLLGKSSLEERVERFAATYDVLVDYILHVKLYTKGIVS